MDAEQSEDLCAHAIVSFVRVVAEMDVGIDGVVALLLEFIGSNLCHQPDASSLLVEIEDDALSLFVNHLHRFVELVAAVAAGRAEDVACDAGGVDTHQNRFVRFPRTFDEGNVFQTVALLAEGDEAEVTVTGRHIYFFTLFHEAFVLETIGDEVFDGQNAESLFFCKFLELRHACHGAVFVENLDETGGRLHARHASQVNGGFCVAGASQHTAVLGVERVDVSRSAEVFGKHVGIGECTDGGGAVVTTHAGCAAFEQVYRHGEGSAQHAGVVLHLVVQSELVAAFNGDGSAEHAASVFQHEVHLLGGDEFSCHDEVAFVFAVFVIDHDDKLSFFEVLKCFFDGSQFKVTHIYIKCVLSISCGGLLNVYVGERMWCCLAAAP